jgi:hypothetical protein
MRHDDKLLLLRSLLAAAILSTVALLDFYAQNIAALANPWRVLHYAAGTLAVAAILAAGLKLSLRKIPLWRIMLATGLMIFAFFAYDVDLIQRELNLGDMAPLAWVAVTLGIGILALSTIRPAAGTVALVLAAGFAAPSVARIAMFALDGHRAQGAAMETSNSHYAVQRWVGRSVVLGRVWRAGAAE